MEESLVAGVDLEREDLIFVGTCDLSGHLRGKAFPARDLESRQP
jgi:glutamine synthetase